MSSTHKTTVCVLISKQDTSSIGQEVVTSDPYHSQRVSVVVWAHYENALEYFCMWDHPAHWHHLDALLTRLAPLAVVHVASTEPISDKQQNAKQHHWARLVHRLLEHLNSRSDLCGMDADMSATEASSAPPSQSLIQWHDKFPNLDVARLEARIQQLLSTNRPALLSYQGDTQLHAGLVARGLQFYLQLSGLEHDDTQTLDSIQSATLDSHLVLDRTAAEAIHLLPPAHNAQAVVTGGTGSTNSIYSIFATACCTSSGKRLLERWVRQPLIDLAKIQHRQDAVATLVHESVQRDALRSPALQGFASIDVTQLAAHLASYEVSSTTDDEPASTNVAKALQALYNLYLVASQKLPLVMEHLEAALAANAETNNNSSLLKDLHAQLVQATAELQRSVELCEAVLDLNLAPREFRIQASYKPELQDVETELAQVQVELETCHKDMQDQWAQVSGKSQVRLETNNDEWQFRLPDTNDSKLLQTMGHVQVHRLLKNGVYFSTVELRQLASKKQDLVAEYDRHQRQVVLDAMKVAATYHPILERTGECVATLDVICAMAHVAAYSPHGYCRPQLTDSDEDGHGIELQGARHPCVELQQDVEYIPNDVCLVFGESSFLLVTGPNMGGKSTYIRALGAIVTLAQIGSYVPCTAAKINLCHHILARVGAGDLQERGISTFMAEMLESSSILRTATKRSLIIIDELGRGTSTFDGYGLARAISEYIVQKVGCLTVFATHFHELTALEDQETVVKNCHVTAQKGSQGLIFLYEVKPGPCLESFGIQVAEMANVPAVVIQDAKRKARELENFEYRSKRTRERDANDSNNQSNDETVVDHAAAEDTASAMDFVNRFRRMPIKSFQNEAEKQAALLQLLEG